MTCWRCGGPHAAVVDVQRSTPACAAECFCDACGVNSHATIHCDAFQAAEARQGAKHDVSTVDDPVGFREDGHGEGDDRGGDRGGGGEPDPAAAIVPMEAGAESAPAAAPTSAVAAAAALAEGEKAARAMEEVADAAKAAADATLPQVCVTVPAVHKAFGLLRPAYERSQTSPRPIWFPHGTHVSHPWQFGPLPLAVTKTPTTTASEERKDTAAPAGEAEATAMGSVVQ